MKLDWRFIFICFLYLSICHATLYEGDPCYIKGKDGICTNQDDCPKLERAFHDGLVRNEEIPRCGYSIHKEIICCPVGDFDKETRSALRPAAQYCEKLEKNVQPALSEHIIGGLPVGLGEYPHMAAIGYRSLDRGRPPFEYNCGGSLIASKYVLTAAHCVTDPRRQPDIVLLGSTSLNATDDDDANGVIINIAKIYAHPEFKPGSSYHDIALIELESEVEFSLFIHPICLHTNFSELSPEAELTISGWGATEYQRKSNVLLAAKVKYVPLENCRRQISRTGFHRRLSEGVQNKQICAINAGEDACSGDSGGPLMLVGDSSLAFYRIIGIIVSGISCGGNIPSFYTRVSAYLDFIEKIVWPHSELS